MPRHGYVAGHARTHPGMLNMYRELVLTTMMKSKGKTRYPEGNG